MIAVLVAVLACSPSALARGGAGHNPATKKLEDAFKVALYVRSVSMDGCYPPAPQLAEAIAQTQEGPRSPGRAQAPESVQRRNIVFVLGTAPLATTYAWPCAPPPASMSSTPPRGTIRVQGKRSGPRTDPGKRGPARGVSR